MLNTPLKTIMDSCGLFFFVKTDKFDFNFFVSIIWLDQFDGDVIKIDFSSDFYERVLDAFLRILF
jgi:hypothetical protein